MILQDVTRVTNAFLAALEILGNVDPMYRRRAAQVQQVAAAIDDVQNEEDDLFQSVTERRLDQAHEIIHRISEILELEEYNFDDGPVYCDDEGEADDGYSFEETDDELSEENWDGQTKGETIDFRKELN